MTKSKVQNRGVDFRGIRLARVAKQERFHKRIQAVCLARLQKNMAAGKC